MKKLTLLICFALVLVFITACTQSTINTTPDATQNTTLTPTAKPTATPTQEPTPTPAETPFENDEQLIIDCLTYLSNDEYEKYLDCFSDGKEVETYIWGEKDYFYGEENLRAILNVRLSEDNVHCWEERIESLSDITLVATLEREYWANIYPEPTAPPYIEDEKMYLVRYVIDYYYDLIDVEDEDIQGINYSFVFIQTIHGKREIASLGSGDWQYVLEVLFDDKYEKNRDLAREFIYNVRMLMNNNAETTLSPDWTLPPDPITWKMGR